MWPIWNDLLSELNELNTNINFIFKSRIKELIQDLKKYYNYLLEKKHKINKCEKETKQTIKLFKRLTKRLNDSKVKYEKLTDILLNNTDDDDDKNSSIKLKQKLNKAKLNYETSIQNYNIIEKEYIKRFTQSCDLFQAAELDHLKTMLQFVNTYTQLCDQLNKEKEKIFQDYKFKLENNYKIEYLFDQLLDNIRTSRKIEQNIDQNNNDFNNNNNNNNDNHLLIANKSQIKSRFSLLKNNNNNSTVSRSNLLIVAVVSEAFDKQIEQINEFESTKRSQNNSNNGIFENMDDFFESVKNKHTTRTHL